MVELPIQRVKRIKGGLQDLSWTSIIDTDGLNTLVTVDVSDVKTDKLLLLFLSNGSNSGNPGTLTVKATMGKDIELTNESEMCMGGIVIDPLCFKHMEGEYKGKILLEAFCMDLMAVELL